MRIAAACAATFAAGMILGAPAQDKPCTSADTTAAEKAVDRVVNWDQLYKAFKDYRHCDKGNVEEVFTEALLRCIVEWKHIEGLAKPMQADKDYREFVVRHLNSPQAKPDIESVYSRAKMNCPKGLDEFCGQIASAVKPFAGMDLSPAAAPTAAAPPAVPPKK
jgi:hypothetical protein